VGQQQLHLLVLAIILVGIAVVMGLDNFQNKAVQSNRDAVILDLNNLASYLLKPTTRKSRHMLVGDIILLVMIYPHNSMQMITGLTM
jgi:hypothetical protein